jgi:hypothetical protein
MMFATLSMQDKVSAGQRMKRLLALILVLTLLVITGTLVSADGKTSATNNELKISTTVSNERRLSDGIR